MLLRNKGSQETYHVPTGVGKAMIHAGFAEEVVPPVKKPVPNATWAVRDGARVGDFQYPPCIYAGCSTCGTTSWMESAKGTAHLTQVFRHCLIVENVPLNIAKEYERRFAEYKSRFRTKKSPPLIPVIDSTVVYQHLAKFHGIKSHDELILAAKADQLVAAKKG
jgi:hypothetical protein